MNRKLLVVFIVAAVCLAMSASPVAAQLYIKNSLDNSPIPDVNKPGVGTPGGPAANDMSCWQAAAANMLAAAGYGTGPSSQARADNIYNSLRNDLGWTNGGSSEYAINYWLYTYAKNPDSVQFQPSNPYTDVTAVARTLTATDYTFLMGELQRCQFVEVSFDNPAHALTMVGGDPGISTTVVHDSDWNAIAPGHDTYTNNFASGQWDLLDATQQTVFNRADGYVTLCPGLNKPEAAMRNYDVAWFLTDNEQYTPGATPRDGVWTPEFRVAGDKAGVFGTPTWGQDCMTLHVPNERIPDMQKEVYLLVDFFARDIDPDDWDIQLKYPTMDPANPFLTVAPTSIEVSADAGQLLFKWLLDEQPEWEEIIFPSALDFYFLEGAVKDWDIAVICVPEPATMALLAIGGLLALRRRRRTQQG